MCLPQAAPNTSGTGKPKPVRTTASAPQEDAEVSIRVHGRGVTSTPVAHDLNREQTSRKRIATKHWGGSILQRPFGTGGFGSSFHLLVFMASSVQRLRLATADGGAQRLGRSSDSPSRPGAFTPSKGKKKVLLHPWGERLTEHTQPQAHLELLVPS